MNFSIKIPTLSSRLINPLLVNISDVCSIQSEDSSNGISSPMVESLNGRALISSANLGACVYVSLIWANQFFNWSFPISKSEF